MKSLSTTLLLFFIFILTNISQAQSIIYTSPKPNSSFVSLASNIIIRCDQKIDAASLTADKFLIQGSASGTHLGVIKLADDQKTILFTPAEKFSANEKVTVKLYAGIVTTGNADVPELSYTFTTTMLLRAIDAGSLISEEPAETEIGSAVMQKTATSATTQDTLPSNFPAITIGTSNNPADGQIFITNKPKGTANAAIGNYLMILNNDGTPAAYKALSQPANLFKMEANGELSFSYLADGDRIILDTTLTPVDTITCANGYETNRHDGLLLPNGHALLFAEDTQPVDMSLITAGGNPNANVIGDVIQEVDEAGNVVFQWRTWDYLDITDSYYSLTAATVDYSHANSLAVDHDGNILFSIRHFSSVIKINRTTGDIMWVLGGKKNQFTFVNENETNSPNYFSYQHCANVLENGNLLLFDNGNQHPTQYSRAAEYTLDTVNMTATLVWEYRHTPDLYSAAMGSVQRLSNGNTMIGWGQMSLSTSPVLTEVHSDGTVALELYMPAGQISYRSLKYAWTSQKSSSDVTAYEILEGNTYSFNSAEDTTGIKIKFSSLDADLYADAYVSKYCYAPVNPSFTIDAPYVLPYYFTIAASLTRSYSGEVHIDLTKYPLATNPQNTIIFGRTSSTAAFAQMPTSYNAEKNELVFTTSLSGQFIMAVPQTVTALAPAGINPANKEIVNQNSAVTLIWGTRGIVKNYRLQVASDSLFSTVLLDQNNLTSTSFNAGILSSGSKYYWRVNNTNSAGTSDWSSILSFSTAAPFISLTRPNGYDTVYIDSSSVIRWSSNVSDTVNIELYKNDTLALVIADSIVTGTNAYLWTLSSSLQADSTYRILVRDITDASLSSKSAANFIITKANTSGVEQTGSSIRSFALSQNYPNPFNPSTTIRYSLPEAAIVQISIFNILGQCIAVLENATKSAGEYQLHWNAGALSSGFYLYSLRAVSENGKTYTAAKKMLLMK